MNTEPEMNVVVFEVKRLWKKENFAEGVSAQANDGVQSAWQSVQAKTGARPAQVRNMYSEWEPSNEDAAFIAHTFPQAEVSYSFARPTDGDWRAAFEEVARTIEAAAGNQTLDEMQEQRRQGQSTLLPILRTCEPGDVFTQVGVHRHVADNLAVFLAYVGPTPRGTAGIDYMMRKDVETSETALIELFETAWQNLRAEMKVNVSEAESEKIYTFSHPGNMAASAIGLPDFYAQVSSWIGPEVFVAFTDPNCLFVVSPQSDIAKTLLEAVQKSEYWGAVALTPACYLLNAEGMRQVATRTSSSA